MSPCRREGQPHITPQRSGSEPCNLPEKGQEAPHRTPHHPTAAVRAPSLHPTTLPVQAVRAGSLLPHIPHCKGYRLALPLPTSSPLQGVRDAPPSPALKQNPRPFSHPTTWSWHSHGEVTATTGTSRCAGLGQPACPHTRAHTHNCCGAEPRGTCKQARSRRQGRVSLRVAQGQKSSPGAVHTSPASPSVCPSRVRCSWGTAGCPRPHSHPRHWEL